MDKIDINLASYTLKISVPSIKYWKVLDLGGRVDYKSKENSFLYSNNVLNCNLVKEEEVNWEFLIEVKLSKDELKKRREEDMLQKEKEV